MIVQLSKKILRKAGYWADIKTIFEKKNFESFVPARSDYELSSNGTILLRSFGLALNVTRHGFFLKGLRYADALQKEMNARFTLVNNEIFAEINNITFNVQTKEELYILNEVFLKQDYGYESKNNFVFIDIGMNVAVTSLFFSAKENCKHIYSFEPFEETYNQALRNITLNKSGHKITAHNFGLGDSDRMLHVDYLPEQKGSMGLTGVPQHVQKDRATKKAHLQIKDVVPVLTGIINQHYQKLAIVLKVDCEGAEYEIIPAMHNAGLLNKVDVVMMEWHEKGPDQLLRSLTTAGFSNFSFNPHSSVIGAIYSTRH